MEGKGEGEPTDIDMDTPIAIAYNRMKKLKPKRKSKANKEAAVDGGEGEGFSVPKESTGGDKCEFPPGIAVSLFDDSVDNHFKAVDTISKLCGEADTDDFDHAEIQRLSSSITFLREWREFSYPLRNLRFSSQNQSKEGGDFMGEIILPQFSSAAVPKKDKQVGVATSSEPSKDFVMYVGGSVWALDWCPRVHSHSDSRIKSEFIAVAAHPPESSYHKIGASLRGRGFVQIWCVLGTNTKKDMPSQVQKKGRRNSRNTGTVQTESSDPRRPRGRPTKEPITGSSPKQKKPRGRPPKQLVNSSQVVNPATEGSARLQSLDLESGNTCDHFPEEISQFGQEAFNRESADESMIVPTKRRRLKGEGSTRVDVAENAVPLCILNEKAELSHSNRPTEESLGLNIVTCDFGSANCSIPDDVALPRMVFCLAHNGEVAWDAKWRPSDVCDKQRMGYLAVLLGDGALEVWDVPFPCTVKVIYSVSEKEGTDPRFIKLKPVLRCPTIKCGGRQSIPLTLEWSTSSPHDIILAGCHDGAVALWKFFPTGSLQETRPLLCFSADTGPIRALAWAPVRSYSESSNVIVTAGPRGLKFWDLRDPFRPLWDFNPVQKLIYSLDWLPDPRCIIASFDDGALRILSLLKAASDVAVTGKPFEATQQKGFHSYLCSPFPIWSVHTSQLTGMVAYCGADGTALRFQLTTRAVERDPLRNRAAHFLCGGLTEENSMLTMFTPLPNTPFPMKKSARDWAEAPRTVRGYTCISNQEKRAKQHKAKVGSDEMHKAVGNRGDLTNTKHAAKSKTSSSSEAGQRLITFGEDKLEVNGEVEEVEVFPSKTVAMHRVRWNPNKGRENWLCYGGAAGVLRFQEIDMCGE